MYYGLWHRDNGTWVWAFGDYDRECVEFERDDMHEGYLGIAKKDLKIVRYARVPTQGQIDAECVTRNA